MKKYRIPLFFPFLMIVFMTIQGLNPLQAQDPFITTWKTDNPGVSDPDQIFIPLANFLIGYDFTVDWGDGTMTDWQDGDDPFDLRHTYTSAGTYTIEISGSFPAIYFSNGGDREKILTIEQWGDIEWSTMEQAFMGAVNLEINASDAPDLSQVTSLSGMFQAALSMNSDLNNWDVSNVTEMTLMFRDAQAFNGNISNWDVSSVEEMSGMFFASLSFNANISAWNVGNITFMNGMFTGATAFNQNIGAWDVSNVQNMSGMFQGASAFNQNLGPWTIGNVSAMLGMLQNAGLSTANYDATLIGWAGKSVQSGVTLTATSLTYCAGASARQSLIDDDNWSISGDALAAGCSPGAFVTTWQTDNPGTSDLDEITIPIHPTDGGYNFSVDWGDGTTTDWQDGDDPADLTHTYPTDGTYTVKITGDFPRIYFYNDGNSSDAEKILSVDQWGDIGWSSMENAFYGASNLEILASDAPDLSGVTSLEGMFHDASSLNSDINHWDVSAITDMQSMFSQAISFNQDIGSWDVSGVQSMNSMFNTATAFNQDIGGWDVSNVTDMTGMFFGANAFNQDLSGWDVSGVTSMNGMFWFASVFDQDIGNWNVSSVTDMINMFNEAATFNQNLGNWSIGNVTNMINMLDESGLTTANYDATLIGWAGQTVQSGVTLGAQNLEYCTSQAARQTLMDSPSNWTITGDALTSGCDPFVLLTGAPGFRMLSAPVEVSLADLLDPIWTQGATNGADYFGGDPNVWIWDNTIPGDDPADWLPVTDFSATVSAGTGTLVYVFDEDEYGNPGSAVWPKTLSVSGTVNSLPVSPTINTNPGGFTLLGNPVNTGIDWDNFTRSEVDNVVYVWDPNKGSGGDWVFWDGATGDLTSGVIHPFQGFFVRTSTGASSPSLEISASATMSPEDFHGKQANDEPLVVSLQMTGEDSLQSTVWLRFSEHGSLASNRGDALKFQPLSTEHLILGLEGLEKEDPSLLTLKHLPLDLDAPLKISLTATSTRGGNFTLETTQLNLPVGWKLTLYDNQTGEERQLTPDTEFTFKLETNEKLYKPPGTDGSVPLTPRPLIQPSDHLKRSDGSESRFILLVTPAGPGRADLPERIALAQNYPNPFNPATVIRYQLPVSSDVRLEVYDMLGRRVATLVNGTVEAGSHKVDFDASNLSSGIYLYRLSSKGPNGTNQLFTKKLTLIK